MAKAVNIARSHRLDGIGEYYFSRRLRELSASRPPRAARSSSWPWAVPTCRPTGRSSTGWRRKPSAPDVHKYMSYKGEPILRKAFADWYGKWYRTELDYNSEVLPLIGSKEGIMHICMTFLDPGDKVLVPNPGYPTYSGRRAAGRRRDAALCAQQGDEFLSRLPRPSNGRDSTA